MSDETEKRDDTTATAGEPATAAPSKLDKKVKIQTPEPKRPGPGRPGRPPGAPNKPKLGGPVPKAKRKAPEELKDTKAALDRYAADARTIAERHNKEHPGDQWEVLVRPKGELAPKLAPEMCAGLFAMGADMLGKSLAVESRPTPEACHEVGKAWSAASAYLPEFDPKWMAFGVAVAATFAAITPMLAERKIRAAGVYVDPQALNDAVRAEEAATAAPGVQ